MRSQLLPCLPACSVDASRLGQLLAVLACLSSLQQAVERKAFEAGLQLGQENGYSQLQASSAEVGMLLEDAVRG